MSRVVERIISENPGSLTMTQGWGRGVGEYFRNLGGEGASLGP